MDFASDNTAGIATPVLAALAAANAGPAAAYGADDWTRRLTERIAALFEHEVAVFPVFTGTAANALALSALCPPHGLVLAEDKAHIRVDECGAPELMSGGARIEGIAGSHGRLAPDALAARLGAMAYMKGGVHHLQASALSLTQATESGTVYRPDEIAALTAIVRSHGLKCHMDGARFANAVAALGCSPADVTWRAGIDVLSFGGTKGGCLGAELVVFFDPALAEGFEWRRKRAGQLASKMRFLSAQMLAWFEDGLWLDLAAHANAMAARLGEGLAARGHAPACPVEANMVFPALPEPAIARLEAAGARFYRWDDRLVRLVCGFETEAADVDRFLALLD